MATDNFLALNKMIDQVGKEKGINKQIVVNAVVQGMLVAAQKKFGTYRDIEAQFNEDSGEVELYEFKEVVPDKEFCDEEVEIKFSQAVELDPEVQLNDTIGSKLESSGLGRIAVQAARQIITQTVRDAEKDIIFEEFESRKGDIASGIARRVERRSIVVDLGKIEAFISPRDQIRGEMVKPGDRIQGFLSEVRQTTRGPQIVMSRACNEYLIKLFEVEVPEIYDGLVEVMGAAREPGQRAKMSVRTKDNAVDPVGACVGMKGTRVQNIVQELSGEKIDIVNYDEDPARYVCNALAPADISKVFMDEQRRSMDVVVPDDQLSLAIGKKGQNVRLAAQLTGWRLDIVSESALNERTKVSIETLMMIDDMTETMAQNIYQSGFDSFLLLADATLESIQNIPGYEDEDIAKKLIANAEALQQKLEEGEIELPKVEEVKFVKTGGSSKAKMSDAEQRLQAELALLDSDEAAKESAEASAEETTTEVKASADEVSSEEPAAEDAVKEEATKEEKK